MSLAELIEQSSSKRVNDNKDVRISVVKGKKITITTISVIFAGGKLLTILTKVTMLKGGQDERVKKV